MYRRRHTEIVSSLVSFKPSTPVKLFSSKAESGLVQAKDNQCARDCRRGRLCCVVSCADRTDWGMRRLQPCGLVLQRFLDGVRRQLDLISLQFFGNSRCYTITLYGT